MSDIPPITDERLAKMIADQEQFSAWTDDPDDQRDALEIVIALRELQQLRTCHREVICRRCGLRDQLGEVPNADF